MAVAGAGRWRRQGTLRAAGLWRLVLGILIAMVQSVSIVVMLGHGAGVLDGLQVHAKGHDVDGGFMTVINGPCTTSRSAYSCAALCDLKGSLLLVSPMHLTERGALVSRRRVRGKRLHDNFHKLEMVVVNHHIV